MVFSLRVANIDDAPAVSALLEASYTGQLAVGYAPEVLVRALPLMTKANPRLLKSGTYYVAEADDQLVGCGGWSKEAPGTHEITEGMGHIRHVATHPGWLRRGIGRALLLRCFREATLAGISTLECHSTLVAVDFYAAAGFKVIGQKTIDLTSDIAIDGMLLRAESF